MDVFKVVLNTRLMKSIVTKLLKKAIIKKYGCEVDIIINDICFETTKNNKVHLHVDADCEMDRDEFMEVVKDGLK